MTAQSGDPAELIHQADRSFVGPPSFEEFASGVAGALERWDDEYRILEQRRAQATDEQIASGVKHWLRAAALDTGALEDLYEVDRGFTLSVASGALAVEAIEAERGADVRRHYVAQLEANEMALDIATTRTPISESWLRQLHEVVTAGQDTYAVLTATGWAEHELPKGTYKQHPNHVLTPDGTVHAYAPVHDAPHLVRELVESASPGTLFDQAHAVTQCAYFHYCLAAVHPFADGNGRVARAAASVFLLRAASVPLVIYADRKDRYLEAVRQADSGRYSAFINFTRDASVTTMRELAEVLTPRGATDTAADAISSAYVARNGTRHDQLDAAANAIRDALVAALGSAVNRITLTNDVDRSVAGAQNTFRVLPNWRALVNGQFPTATISISSRPPAKANASWVGGVVIGTTDDGLDGFAIVNGDAIEARISLDEAVPDISTSLDTRLRSLAERIVHQLVAELAEKVQESTAKRGF